jgi:uncharacterized protein YdaU (DUF1376 family)
VNYYEHHIRDYDAATSHLSWDQDMAYSRLLRWYYRKEQPIPADVSEACRLVRASTKPQRQAVESVLREFFSLREDGWHKDTCDLAIAKFKAGEPERAAKQQNEMTRLTRHRAERASLFGEINRAGLHLPYNAPISEVRALVDRIHSGPATPATLPATGTATPATDLQRLPSPQTPIPRHQTPDTSTRIPDPERAHASRSGEGNGGSEPNTAHELTERIKAVYPAGTYRASNWILAERAISKLLDDGEDRDALLAHAHAFAEQQLAKGSTGTQYVLSPEKFFGPDGHWRGPFPLPKSATETQSDALLAHLQRRNSA